MPLSTDKPSKPDQPSSKSLTPQRKHRKLLKDGSGTEVWPESIEKIFVEGLRQYWESPWATYSRGRSRWRNQFLVDYLQKAGIVRSKKQVASHIQVLRNMWKGEAEFHLVAGGEELFLETGLLAPIKLEDQCDTNTLIALDDDESDTVTSSTPSPGYSPLEFKAEFPPSPAQPLSPMFPHESYSSGGLTTFPTEPLRSRSASPVRMDGLGFSTSSVSIASTFPFCAQAGHPSSTASSPIRNTDFQLNPYPLLPQVSPIGPSGPNYQVPSKIESIPTYPMAFMNYTPTNTSIPPLHIRPPANRITGVCLLADGMVPFTVKVDPMVAAPRPPGRTSPIALQIKLYISSIDDIRSPSTLHGFLGRVSLASIWTMSAKCITKVYAGSACISEEADSLQPCPTNASGGPITAFLPDSSLSRCRWLDASIPTNITQEIAVDNETLIYIVYNIDRRNGDAMPSAELLGCQRYRTNKTSPTHEPHASTITSYPSYPYSQSPTSYGTTPQTQLYSSCPGRTSQTSLSCALTPVDNIRPPAMTTSMLF